MSALLASIATAFRLHPIAMSITAAVMAGGAGTLGTAGYYVAVQENPQIVAREVPVVNGGTNTAGETLDAWIRAGKPVAEWVPVPRDTFRAGETFFTLRHDCFLHKTSGPITRAFLGVPPNGTVYQLPMIHPPTRTEGCSRRNFATVVPKDLPPGQYVYHVAVLFYKNPMQPEVRAAFPDVAITVTP